MAFVLQSRLLVVEIGPIVAQVNDRQRIAAASEAEHAQ